MEVAVQNQAHTITSQPELSSPFLNLLNDSQVDWNDVCNFEGGKVVSFKRELPTNNYRMRPIPTSDRAINEAKEAMLILESALRPATKEQIAVCIKRLSLHCGMQAKAPEDVKYLFLDYCNDLKQYPAQLIESACEKYRKLPEGNSYMPSSGQLIALMQDKHTKMLFMKSRINKILGITTPEKGNTGLSLMEALDKLISV